MPVLTQEDIEKIRADKQKAAEPSPIEELFSGMGRLLDFSQHDAAVWFWRIVSLVLIGALVWFLASRYGSFIKARLASISLKQYFIWTAVVIITVLLIILLIVLIIFVVTLLTR